MTWKIFKAKTPEPPKQPSPSPEPSAEVSLANAESLREKSNFYISII